MLGNGTAGTYIHKIAEVKHEEVVLDRFIGQISGKKHLELRKLYQTFDDLLTT